MVPHTAAKHLLLKRYLERWFPILGRYNQRINYIDGFAGPGEYLGGEHGSPLLAIEAARHHVERGTLAPNVQINFIFVEANLDYARHLQASLGRIPCPAQFEVRVIPGEFADVIGSSLDELEKQRGMLDPTFAFVDPFGFSGIPLNLLARILRYPKCEIFVNIMIEFINRFLAHPNEDVVAHVPRTFGTDAALSIAHQTGNRVAGLLNLYRSQLSGKAKYVGRFDMHGRRDQKTYSLFFASNSAKGFLKMKEAMWSVDKAQGGKFSDADPAGAFTFDLFGFQPLWDEMLRRFGGKLVSMGQIERYVTEQTDYLPMHARSILKSKEADGAITVQVTAGQKRRKGDFPVGKVSIAFPS
jgi:three-Cys-motif partner protein